ncbi:MAG: hypothetical protein J6S49_09955 [Erysipelotrichaceae bacterium]|nr:hypothetical protein [Erysipelotrichaceae bacterium]MBP5278940.1 hypothetical protein [Erysipelotrichaceae bacterium]
MIRTKAVKLSVIPAIAFRQKLGTGGSGVTIIRSDTTQPGMAAISRTSGEAIPNKQTDLKLYPMEAFAEALELTKGLPYKKQKGAKANEKLFMEEHKEDDKFEEEEVIIDSAEYQKIIDRYSDKNGKLSYDLMNKDFIKFLKSSSVVRDMVAEGKSAAAIRNYVISHKIRNITGNDQLSAKELKKIVELLDEVSPKGVYKELDNEIRRMLTANKKKK